MARMGRNDALGRTLGAFAFVLGLAVIVVVLFLTYRLFQDPGLGRAAAARPGAEPTFLTLAAGFADLVVRVLLLLVGSISGSLIATRGLRMYSSALDRPTPADPGDAPAD